MLGRSLHAVGEDGPGCCKYIAEPGIVHSRGMTAGLEAPTATLGVVIAHHPVPGTRAFRLYKQGSKTPSPITRPNQDTRQIFRVWPLPPRQDTFAAHSPEGSSSGAIKHGALRRGSGVRGGCPVWWGPRSRCVCRWRSFLGRDGGRHTQGLQGSKGTPPCSCWPGLIRGDNLNPWRHD